MTTLERGTSQVRTILQPALASYKATVPGTVT